MSLHMDKAKLRQFFALMYETCGNLKTTTASINGTKDVTVWEWNIEWNDIGKTSSDDKDAHVNTGDGRLVKMIGVGVTYWNEEGKIVKNNDYGKIVESFEKVAKR